MILIVFKASFSTNQSYHLRKQSIFSMNPNMHTKFEINIWNSFVFVAYIMIIEEGKWKKVHGETMATFFIWNFRKLHRNGAGLYEGYCKSMTSTCLHAFM